MTGLGVAVGLGVLLFLVKVFKSTPAKAPGGRVGTLEEVCLGVGLGEGVGDGDGEGGGEGVGVDVGDGVERSRT